LPGKYAFSGFSSLDFLCQFPVCRCKA